MQLFFTPDITDSEFFTLNESESKHCIKVLRLNEGDKINLVDGKGTFFEAEIINSNPKKCGLKILEKTDNYNKLNYNLTIAIAPTKNNDRLEWFCEKATEIGIDTIIPIISFNSERRNINPEKFNNVIISAIKQSYKAYKPTFTNIIKFTDLIKKPFNGKKYIAHCNPPYKQFSNLKTIYNKNENALIVIGPEGDFSPEEVKLAVENNFQEISLGNFRLRTETAGIVAVTTISLLNN